MISIVACLYLMLQAARHHLDSVRDLAAGGAGDLLPLRRAGTAGCGIPKPEVVRRIEVGTTVTSEVGLGKKVTGCLRLFPLLTTYLTLPYVGPYRSPGSSALAAAGRPASSSLSLKRVRHELEQHPRSALRFLQQPAVGRHRDLASRSRRRSAGATEAPAGPAPGRRSPVCPAATVSPRLPPPCTAGARTATSAGEALAAQRISCFKVSHRAAASSQWSAWSRDCGRPPRAPPRPSAARPIA